VSISNHYAQLANHRLASRGAEASAFGEDSHPRYRQLALETPARRRDALLRTVDVLLVVLPALPLRSAAPIALIVLVRGPSGLYRGSGWGAAARVHDAEVPDARSDASRASGFLGGSSSAEQQEFTPMASG